MSTLETDMDTISNSECNCCGISGCCNPLECLKHTIVNKVGCFHGEKYYADLAVARSFSRWILSNGEELFKNTLVLESFHKTIDGFFRQQYDVERIDDFHNKWDSELRDYGLKTQRSNWVDVKNIEDDYEDF